MTLARDHRASLAAAADEIELYGTVADARTDLYYAVNQLHQSCLLRLKPSDATLDAIVSAAERAIAGVTRYRTERDA